VGKCFPFKGERDSMQASPNYFGHLFLCLGSSVVFNLGSRDPLGVPNANLGGPKRKSGISTNFPQYK